VICVKKNNPGRIILNLAFDRCDFDDMYRPSGVKGQLFHGQQQANAARAVGFDWPEIALPRHYNF
jgi:hypothetical protein